MSVIDAAEALWQAITIKMCLTYISKRNFGAVGHYKEVILYV